MRAGSPTAAGESIATTLQVQPTAGGAGGTEATLADAAWAAQSYSWADMAVMLAKLPAEQTSVTVADVMAHANPPITDPLVGLAVLQRFAPGIVDTASTTSSMQAPGRAGRTRTFSRFRAVTRPRATTSAAHHLAQTGADVGRRSTISSPMHGAASANNTEETRNAADSVNEI
jgi:hypothetical protein